MHNVVATAECHICGRVAQEKFSAPCDYRQPSIKKSYPVYWCDSCDYGFLWPRPTREEIADFYQVDDYYTHRSNDDKRIANAESPNLLDRLRAHLAWRLDCGQDFEVAEVKDLVEFKTPRVLDVGCGSGGILVRFASHGFSVVGVEPDPEARRVARERGHEVFDGTAEELPNNILEMKLDVVLMSHVLEHCLNVDAALSNLKRMVKTDGILVVEVPNCECNGFRVQQAAWPWSDIPRHLNFFTPKSLKVLLRRYGFTIVAEKFTGFTRQFSNEWLTVESDVWRAFRNAESESVNGAQPNFKLRAWRLLLRALFSKRAAKYDSVRILAIKSGAEIEMTEQLLNKPSS